MSILYIPFLMLHYTIAPQMTLGMSSNPASLLPDASGEILQQLDMLRQRTQETGEDLRRMEQEQEAFALEYHELTKIQANLTHLQNQPPSQQKAEFEKQLRVKKEMCEQKLNLKVVDWFIICADLHVSLEIFRLLNFCK